MKGREREREKSKRRGGTNSVNDQGMNVTQSSMDIFLWER